MEVLFNQKLEIDNLLSFRDKVRKNEINDIVKDMYMDITKFGNEKI